MDITHTCIHCCKRKKVFRVTLDLYDENGLLRRGVQRCKKFMFTCDYCSKKSFLDFYRFSHPDVILLLKRLERKQDELIRALDQIITVLEKYVSS